MFEQLPHKKRSRSSVRLRRAVAGLVLIAGCIAVAAFVAPMVRGGSDGQNGNAQAAKKAQPVARKPRPPAIPAYITAQACEAKGATLRYSANTRAKQVALTFDDGPGPATSQVLDHLKRHKQHGTFFVIGNQVRGYRNVVQRAVREGHAMGNHTWDHRVPGLGARNELAYTQKVIKEVAGVTPCVSRAPGGRHWAFSAESRRQKLNLIQWSGDTSDWARPAPSVIASRTLAAVKPGAIILMHDGGGPRGNTVAALPAILRGLKARGYKSVTVPELLRLTKQKPKPKPSFRQLQM